MSILLVDPVGEFQDTGRKALRKLKQVSGMKVGFVFNQQMSALAFWQKLEDEVERSLKPAAVQKIHKSNTYAPAPTELLDRMVRETDYSLVGVGA